ncbi:hypothetical protein LOTGIDRAFT_232758 [Lottia gigantea]|uniref:Uncharacterized protein n=1 Tax=Lottia gigantea TaxID=225164 RepID=V4AE27_LOTGI|nr:hypothetical protein LOTGIDRAFT_232758 [Lottia gigantea]ESO93355.1 hypothetical protein LOTGIDRAFT_232758 [Lottia gigantea]
MPTSSQALILINADGILPKQYSKIGFLENKPCQLSRVSVHGETQSQQNTSLLSASRYQLAGYHLEQDSLYTSPRSERDPLPTSTVKGYRGVFAFDPVTRSFTWQLLNDSAANRLPSPNREGLASRFYKNRISVDKLPMCNAEDETLLPIGRVPDPVTFEKNIRRLMELGFRTDSKLLENKSNESENNSKSNSPSKNTQNETYKLPSCVKKMGGSSLLPSRMSSEPAVSVSAGVSDLADKTTLPHIPKRMDSFVLNYKSVSTPTVAKKAERALYEEVKLNDSKKKKKKYIPTIRMRRELPPLNSNMLCFNFYDGNLSHKDVKNMIESQSEGRILDLKFDPIYVHLGEASSQYKCMWVFSISDLTARTQLLYNGLRFNGERIKVRLYDDVMKEEHNAYKFFKEVENEHIERKVKSGDRESKVSSVLGFDSPNLSSNINLYTINKNNIQVTAKSSRTRRQNSGKKYC